MKNPRGVTFQPKERHIIIADERQLWELHCKETPPADQSCREYGRLPFPKLAAETFDPLGVSADSIGTIFFADNLTQTVKMATASNQMTTIVGSGLIKFPYDVELDPSSSDLYISDRGSGGVYVLECSISDDGFCNEYEKAPVGLHRIPEFDGVLVNPTGIAVDFLGNLFVTDARHGKIFRLDKRTRQVTTLLGSDILAAPNGLAVNLDTFDVLVADSRNNREDAAALYRLPCSNIAMPCTKTPNMDNIVSGSCLETISETKCFYNCQDGFTPMGVPWIQCMNGRFQTSRASCGKRPTGLVPACTDYNTGATTVVPVPFNFVNPVDVIIDGDSNVYVLDKAQNTLYNIAAKTGKATVVENSMSLKAPLAMGLHPTNGDIFISVSDVLPKLYNGFAPILQLLCPNPLRGARPRVTCAQYNKFAEHRTVGMLPNGQVLCDKPGKCALTSIAVDAKTSIFLADTQNNRIIRSEGGKGNIKATILLGADKVPGLQAVQLAGYRAEGGSWDLYIADSKLGIVVLRCLDATLATCNSYATNVENAAPTSSITLATASMAFDGSRNLFVEDNSRNRVIKFPWVAASKTFGNFVPVATKSRSSTASNPDTVGISVDPNNGVVYVADSSLSAVEHSKHHQILRIGCNTLEYRCLALSNTDAPNVKPGTCANTAIGDKCTVNACKEGYQLRNPIPKFNWAKCTATGWTINRDLACEAFCMPLRDVDIPNVDTTSCARTAFSRPCKVVCAKGFVLKDPSKNMASCTNEGYWQAGSGVACVPVSTTTKQGKIASKDKVTPKPGPSPVARAATVVLVLAIVIVLTAGGVALYCVLRMRKAQSDAANAMRMKGNLLDQDGAEAFDAHEI